MEPQADPSASAAAVMRSIAENSPVLVTTADHALLTAPVVDYFCSEARRQACDVVVGLASYDLVASAYRGVQRTAVRLQDTSVSSSSRHWGGFPRCSFSLGRSHSAEASPNYHTAWASLSKR
jgi:hypothetical protein